jgi:hypothetical protein
MRDIAVSALAPATPRAGATGGAGHGTNPAEDLVGRYQRQLVADQHAADAVLYQTQADLAHEQSVCQGFLNSLGHTPSSAAGTTGSSVMRNNRRAGDVTPMPSTTPTTSAPISGPGPGGTDCQALLREVLAEQETLDNDLRAVATDEVALDAAVAQLLAQSPGRQPDPATGQPGQPGQPGQQSQPSPAPTGSAGTGTEHRAGSTETNTRPTTDTADTARGGAGRAGAATGGTLTGGSRTGSGASRVPASAAQIAADQASVDAASATVLVATQSLDQARLISPIGGLVAAVSITPGQAVAAGSSTAAIVVVNPGSMEIMTTVSDSNIAAVTVGATVTVTPDGTDAPTAGTVVAIGLLPAASGGTAGSNGTAYPVTIGLTGGGSGLFAGSGAAVSIVVSRAADTLAVPTSAVRTIGNRHVVSVLRDATVTSLPVQVGTVGVAFTQVTSGLSEGDRVVLADLHAPLPASNTTVRGLGGTGRAGVGTGTGFGGGRAGP